jgi:hypothetical protein
MTTTTRDFECSASDLYTVLVEPETYPSWLVGAKKIRTVDPTWPAIGSEFHHVVGFGPLAIPDRTTSVGYELDRVLELIVRVRPVLEARVRFEVEPVGTGSRLTMTETPIGPFAFLAPVAEPLIKARNDRSLERLSGVVDERHGPSKRAG